MDLKLLVLSRYSRLGASSRLRTLQYQPFLEAAGLVVEHVPFFDDHYLTRLYAGQTDRTALLRYFSNRLRALRMQPRPDLIWLEYEALPWLPWAVEAALMPSGVPIVSDYDDAVFHRYDRHRLPPVRLSLGRKIDRVMASSALVTAGNTYLADRANAAGASQVEVVPTVVDLDHYPFVPVAAARPRPRVGWIGTPETWEGLAKPIHQTLLPVLHEMQATFRAIGASLIPTTGERLEMVPWREADEANLIRSTDIGVMPLPDTLWARGKCGYKLIQYMACGLPVVASPVGVNCTIVEHGVTGFLASSDEEWRDAIATLLADPDLRRQMGEQGRRRVEQRYSLQLWGPRVATLLREKAAHA